MVASDTIVGIVGAVVLVGAMAGVFIYEYNNVDDADASPDDAMTDDGMAATSRQMIDAAIGARNPAAPPTPYVESFEVLGNSTGGWVNVTFDASSPIDMGQEILASVTDAEGAVIAEATGVELSLVLDEAMLMPGTYTLTVTLQDNGPGGNLAGEIVLMY